MDLKCYCTQDMYDDYKQGKLIYVCSPEVRKILFDFDDVKKHRDLNIRLSINKKTHRIEKERGCMEGWYAIQKGGL